MSTTFTTTTTTTTTTTNVYVNTLAQRIVRDPKPTLYRGYVLDWDGGIGIFTFAKGEVCGWSFDLADLLDQINAIEDDEE
jgi:hypothetical protein